MYPQDNAQLTAEALTSHAAKRGLNALEARLAQIDSITRTRSGDAPTPQPRKTNTYNISEIDYASMPRQDLSPSVRPVLASDMLF